jgi:hypothetical protein
VNARAVLAICAPDSQKVLERAGMEVKGVFRTSPANELWWALGGCCGSPNWRTSLFGKRE